MIGFGVSIVLAQFNIGLEKKSNSDSKSKIFSLSIIKALFPLWGTVLLLLVTRVPEIGIKQLLTLNTEMLSITLGSLAELKVSNSLVVQLESIFGTDISWSFKTLYIPWLIPFVLISLCTLIIFKQSPAQCYQPFKSTFHQLRNPVIALLGALVYVRLLMSGGDQASSVIIGNALADVTGGSWTFFASYLGAIGSFFQGLVLSRI